MGALAGVLVPQRGMPDTNGTELAGSPKLAIRPLRLPVVRGLMHAMPESNLCVGRSCPRHFGRSCPRHFPIQMGADINSSPGLWEQHDVLRDVTKARVS